MSDAGTAYVKIRPDFSSLNSELAQKINPIADQFGNKFGKALGPVMAQQSKHLRTFTTGAKYAAAGGAALALVVGKDIVNAGMQFEKQMSANSAVSEANRKQMLALERQSIKLGAATFYSATQAAEAQGELIKGGLSLKQVLGGGLPAALHLAEAGQLELATAAETTVNAMKLFGIGGKEANSVADMLSTAANRTTADVIDFAEALKYGGSVSKLAGYSLNETMVVLEAMAEAGIKGSMAGTTYKTAIIQLLKPTKKQSELQEELGFHLLTGNGRLKDAAELSVELHRATDGMTKAERTKTLATLAGQRGVIGLNAVLEKTPKQFKALEKANSKQGTAQEIASKKMNNLAGEWEQFKGSLETVEIQIYKGAAPALKDLAGEATEALNRVGKVFNNPSLSNSEKIQKAASIISHELSRMWDRYHVGDHLIEGLDKFLNDAVPRIAEGAGKLGLEFAKGFVEGFTHADLLGKLVMGSWLLNFIGGKAPFIAIGKSLGKTIGINLAEETAKTAAPLIATETAAATRAAAVTTAAPVWTPASPALGSGAARKAAAEATSRALLAESFGDFSLATPAAQKTLDETGRLGARAYVKGFVADARGRLPELTATTTEMAGRLGRGLATYGIGGLVVGEISKEIVGGNTGHELASAFQGAGAGAAIGSAIAPGIGTALGAVLGGAGGLLAEELGGNDLGDQYAEGFLRSFEKKLPQLHKALTRMEFGTPGHSAKKEITVAGAHVVIPERVGASGLRGARAGLREQIAILKESGASEKALDALRQKLALVDKALHEGARAVQSYNHGFDLLRSGAVTRMSDINKVTHENLAKIDQVWKNNPPKWHQAMAESMKASIAAIRSGMQQEVITQEAGQKRIQNLARNLRLFEGRDPLGLAKGFSNSWAEAGKVTNRQIQAQLRELNKMPKGAREAAREAMVQMAHKMEAEGKLVKGSAARLNSALTTKFGQTNKQISESTGRAMAHIAQSVAEGATNVGGALSNIFDNLANALAAVGDSKVPTFSLSTLSASSQYHHAREATQSGLGHPPQKKQDGGFIVPGTGSGDTFKTMIPAGSFVENREAVRGLPFQTGGLIPVMLEPGERVHFPAAVHAIGKDVLEARNRAVPRFQTGGLLHPKLNGPAGPVQSLGQDVIDRSFNAVQRYYRTHMEPPRILRALRAMEAQAHKGWPYVYGGGHGGFHGPFDCSGYVSYGLHAADFINTPLAVQQGSGLYTLGAPGPGKFLTWGVRGSSGMSAHTMMAIKAPGGKWKYFESGGSGGGAHEDSGWDGSFQLRHMPGFQRGGTVPDRAKQAIVRYGQEAFNPRSPHFVGWGYRLGGLVQKLAKGGWVKTGYTIYTGSGAGAGGDLQKGHGYAELGTATTSGASTGHGYIAEALGRSGELPFEFPLDVKIASTGKIAKLYKRDRGYGQGTPAYSIDIHQLAWPELGLSEANGKGSAFIRPASGSGKESDEHSFKEKVPALFEGAKTRSLNLPSVPKNRHGLEAAIDHWRKELRIYRKAKQVAEKKNRPGVAQAIAHNITALEGFLRQLHGALHKVKLEAARKKFSRRIKGKLGKVAGYEQIIEGLQRDFDIANERAEEVVALEPQMPEFPANWSDGKKAEEEKAFVGRLSGYIDGPETSAYGDLLGRLASWRTAIVKAEIFGFGSGKPSVQRMEATSEKKVYEVVSEIAAINQYTERVAADIAGFKHDHPKAKELPKWIKNEIKERDKRRRKLPFLRTEDQELRQLIGELREKFYPGDPDNNRINPPAPPLEGTGTLEEALVGIQGIHWPDLHEILPASALQPPRSVGGLGGTIWDVQTSIEELGLKKLQAANGLEGTGGGSTDESESTALLRELVTQANQEKIIRAIEKGVIGPGFRLGGEVLPPYAGKAHTGAIVPGPSSQERTMVLKGGEGVFTEEQMAALGPASGNASGGPILFEELHVHPDGRVSGVYQGQEFEAAVRKVVHHDQQQEARRVGTRRAGRRL
ncbi:MAG TPA: phage tail tape measure protein [Solirubrobacterales bacterium]|nr:phage tail tape measure protein [Solirubrobacterales bacterium]